jgi:hypothetical protein
LRLVAASRLEKLVHYRPELRAAVVVVETRGLEILCRHTTFVRRPDRKVRV